MDVFFFFQAEDGIRDATVTGVQTCALPIWAGDLPSPLPLPGARPPARGSLRGLEPAGAAGLAAAAVDPPRPARQRPDSVAGAAPARLLRAPHAGTGAADVRPPRDGLAAGRPAAGGLP